MCITCTGIYIVDPISSLCICPDNKTLLEDGSCVIIPVVDPCQNKPYIYRDSGACTDTCVTGYYLNVIDNICENCAAGCSSCVDGSDCINCYNGFYLNKTTLKCECDLYRNGSHCVTASECGLGRYADSISMYCVNCGFGC